VERPAISSSTNGWLSYPRIQFGIRHLLVIGIWLSLLLTAIRLSGVDFQVALSVVIAWLIYQAVTLWVGGWLVHWFGRRKARRQSRST
jgi:Kef-type K+ transport system membrane component KefB